MTILNMSTTEDKPVPQVNILFSTLGFTASSPDTLEETLTPNDTIFSWGGVNIAKSSPSLIVKYGSHVTINEPKSMKFVNENTRTLQIPKVYACYTYGPIERDIGDYGSLFDTYIFMDFVEGEDLDRAWEGLDKDTKERVAGQLKGYLAELRDIGNDNEGYIGSVDGGHVADPVLAYHSNRGLFESEETFNNALIDAYQSKLPRSHVRCFLTGMLSQYKHRSVFTHGDLRLANIKVKNGHVTGILGWNLVVGIVNTGNLRKLFTSGNGRTIGRIIWFRFLSLIMLSMELISF